MEGIKTKLVIELINGESITIPNMDLEHFSLDDMPDNEIYKIKYTDGAIALFVDKIVYIKEIEGD